MKHNIGDVVYWVYSSTHHGKKIPCPMCFGKRFVTIILGDESQEKIECGMCQHGLERPSGLAHSWEAVAEVRSGTITGISSRDGIRYEVGYETLRPHEIFSTEAEAQSVREIKFVEVKKQAEEWFKQSFVTTKKTQIWSAGYHRDCIKRAERTISWHQMRLAMIKDTPSNEDME